jgi:hypothetical protein
MEVDTEVQEMVDKEIVAQEDQMMERVTEDQDQETVVQEDQTMERDTEGQGQVQEIQVLLDLPMKVLV